jgi:hypothetical protein
MQSVSTQGQVDAVYFDLTNAFDFFIHFSLTSFFPILVYMLVTLIGFAAIFPADRPQFDFLVSLLPIRTP